MKMKKKEVEFFFRKKELDDDFNWGSLDEKEKKVLAAPPVRGRPLSPLTKAAA